MVFGLLQGNNKRKATGSGAVDVLQQCYAQTQQELDLFTDSSRHCLTLAELLAAFPSGRVPSGQPFTCRGQQWRLQSRRTPCGRTVHLAVPSSSISGAGGPDQQQQQQQQPGCRRSGTNSAKLPNQRSSSRPGFSSNRSSDMDNSSKDCDDDYAMQRYGSAASAGCGAALSPCGSAHYQRQSSGGLDPGAGSPGLFSTGKQQQQQQHAGSQQSPVVGSGGSFSSNPGDADLRKFHRHLLHATNTRKETLERYKAIMAMIEACKRRVAAFAASTGSNLAAGNPGGCWGSEPGCSVVQAVLDVGEALASFGNHQFPEHSNEGRAILAGDYKALLRQYLSAFGWLFSAPTKAQLPLELQEEVQSVGSLLATRCEAYDLLYDQLVRHVGLEGRGSGPATLILNSNSATANPATSITANPTNTTTAAANSKSKAVNKGLGGAAVAAAAVAGLLLLRAMRGGGGGGRKGGSRGGGGGSKAAGSSAGGGQPRQLRIPKGRNGRELLLVSQLSACGDELRRAAANDALLRDDWRLGRHVRLAWPPGPPLPPGYTEVGVDACNVSQLLQEMYG